VLIQKLKIMKAFQSLLFLTLIVVTGAKAQTTNGEKPTIIFVHGIWADGSCWTSQIEALQAKGYHVIFIQNAVTGLADDVAATQRAIDLVKGKIILVGHSWGGMVITLVEVLNNPAALKKVISMHHGNVPIHEAISGL
jgi:pimeloyl-ACP methyl ester carboxylesterase